MRPTVTISWPVWLLVVAIVLGGLVRAASCEPHEARWADLSEQAEGYEWRWAPIPTGDPETWGEPAWETLAGPQTPDPWPYCWSGEVQTPGSGWLQVRAVAAGREPSAWSRPFAVPEPGIAGLVAGVLGLGWLTRRRR